jgi:hypothetical protein
LKSKSNILSKKSCFCQKNYRFIAILLAKIARLTKALLHLYIPARKNFEQKKLFFQKVQIFLHKTFKASVARNDREKQQKQFSGVNPINIFFVF